MRIQERAGSSSRRQGKKGRVNGGREGREKFIDFDQENREKNREDEKRRAPCERKCIFNLVNRRNAPLEGEKILEAKESPEGEERGKRNRWHRKTIMGG